MPATATSKKEEFFAMGSTARDEGKPGSHTATARVSNEM